MEGQLELYGLSDSKVKMEDLDVGLGDVIGGAREISADPQKGSLSVPTAQGRPFLSNCLFSISDAVISIKPINSLGEKSLQHVVF